MGRKGLAVGLMMWIAFALAFVVTNAASAQEAPFTATVVEDKVEVLAGAGRTFYVVGSLTKGATVTVDEVVYGWNKIVAPQGVFSYVSKAFIDAKADGKTGVVNTDDKAKVQAASLAGAGDSYRHQLTLKKGEIVQIAGDEGSFFKIVPPKGAYVYLPPGSVRRVEGAVAKAETPKVEPAKVEPPKVEPPKVVPPKVEVKTPEAPKPEAPKVEPPKVEPAKPVEVAKAPEAPKPEAPNPEAPKAETPTVTMSKPAAGAEEIPKDSIPKAPKTPVVAKPETPAAPKPAPAPAPVSSEPVAATASDLAARVTNPALRDLESRLAAAQKQPLAQQPLETLLAGYKALYLDNNVVGLDRQVVSVRVPQIERALKVQQAIKALDAARVESSKPIEIPKPAPPPTPGVYDPSKYDSVGQLLASSVYDGDSGPRLFRLVEPGTGRTIAYVQPANSFDPKHYLGKTVGIIGQGKYDPAVRLNVIEVKQIDLLQATGESAPKPAETPAETPAGAATATPTK